jgi:hypothetical protein
MRKMHLNPHQEGDWKSEKISRKLRNERPSLAPDHSDTTVPYGLPRRDSPMVRTGRESAPSSATGFERSKSILDEEREREERRPRLGFHGLLGILSPHARPPSIQHAAGVQSRALVPVSRARHQDRGGERHVPVGCLNKLCEVEKLGHATRWSMLLELIRAPPPRYSANSQILARLL